jgi:DNA-binding transcriptional ArsR family regulator
MSRPRSGDNAFRAISDLTRRRMFDMLRERECTVGEVMQTLRLRKSVTTFHLSVLMQAGLVRQRRRGRHLVCVPDQRPLSAVQGWLGRHLAGRSSRLLLARQ